jgi:folate-dependent phosphoribosylglycinamide formyltransferase PurN
MPWFRLYWVSILKIVIFTRTGFHHTSFINRLQERFEVACVVREAYPEGPKKNALLSAYKSIFRKDAAALIRDEQFLKKFSSDYSAGFRFHPMFSEYLRAYFDVMVEKEGTKYLNIRCGEINSPRLLDYLKPFKPDVIAVLGSSVLRQEMISLPSSAVINIHSGLSPYYRGTWSYGWPLVNREPEYIGVTVHYINAGIDTGDIIYQTRPLLSESDDLNTIFLKVIAEGIELMVKAIEEISSRGSIVSHQQPAGAGRLYKIKDFNAAAARTCLKNLEDGVIGAYLSKREERDRSVKLFGYMLPEIFR